MERAEQKTELLPWSLVPASLGTLFAFHQLLGSRSAARHLARLWSAAEGEVGVVPAHRIVQLSKGWIVSDACVLHASALAPHRFRFDRWAALHRSSRSRVRRLEPQWDVGERPARSTGQGLP